MKPYYVMLPLNLRFRIESEADEKRAERLFNIQAAIILATCLALPAIPIILLWCGK